MTVPDKIIIATEDVLVLILSLDGVKMIVDALRVHKPAHRVQAMSVAALAVLCSDPGLFTCPIFMRTAKHCALQMRGR